jgi:hypothetical protein
MESIRLHSQKEKRKKKTIPSVSHTDVSLNKTRPSLSQNVPSVFRYIFFHLQFSLPLKIKMSYLIFYFFKKKELPFFFESIGFLYFRVIVGAISSSIFGAILK